MFRDFFYKYHLHPWHWVFPMSIGLVPFWLTRRYGYDPLVLVFAAYMYYMGVLVGLWMYRVGVMAEERETLIAQTGTPPRAKPEPEMSRPDGFKAIPNLGEVKLRRVNDYQFQVQTLREPDMRWRQWAQALCEGQPLTQSKWTGQGRPFSKPEYTRKIGELLSAAILVPDNPKSESSTPKPNGARGWDYIKALADGRENIPLPLSEKG